MHCVQNFVAKVIILFELVSQLSFKNLNYVFICFMSHCLCPCLGQNRLRDAKKSARSGLPVRAGRTPSPRRANSEFARRELFGLPKPFP